MALSSAKKFWWIALSLLAALVLAVVPLPTYVDPARPAWVALVLVYWHVEYNPRLGFLISWCAGLLMDGLTGSLLGEHALALVILSFCAMKLARFIRTFPLWQQSLALIPLLIVYEFILFWIDGTVGRSAPMLWRWLPVLSSVLLWPLLAYSLDRMTRRETDN